MNLCGWATVTGAQLSGPSGPVTALAASPPVPVSIVAKTPNAPCWPCSREGPMNPYHQAWTEAAVCRSVGGDVWFSEIGEPTWMEARRICKTCPVLWQCVDWVMRAELGTGPQARFGVTGGMTPNQRIAYEPQWLAEQQREGAA